MISTFNCKNCGRTCQCNPRVKDQEYCFRKKCQQARKNKWEKKKYRTNKEYRASRLKSQENWRKDYLHKKYQKEYRSRHPDYVAQCYKDQKERYHERREAERKALEQNNVNTDAFIVKMQILSG